MTDMTELLVQIALIAYIAWTALNIIVAVIR